MILYSGHASTGALASLSLYLRHANAGVLAKVHVALADYDHVISLHACTQIEVQEDLVDMCIPGDVVTVCA